MENNKEQLLKLSKIFNTDNVITSDEIEQVLKGIMSIMSSFKKSNETLNSETKQTVSDLMAQVEENHAKWSDTHDTKSNTTLSQMEGKIATLKALIAKVKTIKPKDGKNADETKIVAEVLSKIPPVKEVTLDTPEIIVEKLETLEGEDRLDVSSIKEAPRMTVSLSAPENPAIGDLWAKA